MAQLSCTRKEDLSWAPALLSLCSLAVETIWPAASRSHFPSGTVAPLKGEPKYLSPFLLSALSRNFITEMTQVTKTNTPTVDVSFLPSLSKESEWKLVNQSENTKTLSAQDNTEEEKWRVQGGETNPVLFCSLIKICRDFLPPQGCCFELFHSV